MVIPGGIGDGHNATADFEGGLDINYQGIPPVHHCYVSIKNDLGEIAEESIPRGLLPGDVYALTRTTDFVSTSGVAEFQANAGITQVEGWWPFFSMTPVASRSVRKTVPQP